MKRALWIAALLEVLKYVLIIILAFFLDAIGTNKFEETVEKIIGFVFFLWFLPELMIGGENPPHHWHTIVARLCAGVLWNFPVALYLSSLLPYKMPATDANEPLSKPKKTLDI